GDRPVVVEVQQPEQQRGGRDDQAAAGQHAAQRLGQIATEQDLLAGGLQRDQEQRDAEQRKLVGGHRGERSAWHLPSRRGEKQQQELQDQLDTEADSQPPPIEVQIRRDHR